MASTIGNIFECIKKRINDNVDFVNDVSIYQQQDIFQDENRGFKPPVVFIHFEDIEYEDTSYKVQMGSMSVTVKLLVEEYTKDYLKALEKKEQLNSKLNFWTEWGFDLIRRNETVDIDADSLYLFEITYETSFYEEIFTDDKILIGGTNGTYGMCLELFINDTSKGLNPI